MNEITVNGLSQAFGFGQGAPSVLVSAGWDEMALFLGHSWLVVEWGLLGVPMTAPLIRPFCTAEEAGDKSVNRKIRAASMPPPREEVVGLEVPRCIF